MKVSLFLAVGILLSAVEFGCGQSNYCQASTCSGKQHIGCNNNGAFGSQCTSSAKAVPISDALKTFIVKKHNTLRNSVASGGLSGFQPAARMATMQWDAELASLALLNAKQCVMQHDGCRATTQFPYAGQNLAYSSWTGSGTKTVQAITNKQIQAWFNEQKDATMSQINKYQSNGKKVGHFIQMVVERATHVGCGIVRQTKGSATNQFLACNYGFITFLNKPVYSAASKAGSQCQTGTNPNFKALCSINEVYDVKKP